MSWNLLQYRTPSSMVLSWSFTLPKYLALSAAPSKSATVTRSAGSKTGYRSRWFHRGFTECSTLGVRVQYGPHFTTTCVVVGVSRPSAPTTSTDRRPTRPFASPPCKCSKYSSSKYARTKMSPYFSPFSFNSLPSLSTKVIHRSSGAFFNPLCTLSSETFKTALPIKSSNLVASSCSYSVISKSSPYGFETIKLNARSHSGSVASSM